MASTFPPPWIYRRQVTHPMWVWRAFSYWCTEGHRAHPFLLGLGFRGQWPRWCMEAASGDEAATEMRGHRRLGCIRSGDLATCVSYHCRDISSIMRIFCLSSFGGIQQKPCMHAFGEEANRNGPYSRSRNKNQLFDMKTTSKIEGNEHLYINIVLL